MSATEEEFDFVTSELPAGLSVIEASAGTGKTYALSHLVPRLVLDESVAGIGEIALVTFTNDAARELAERVRGVLERLHAAPRPDEETSDAGVFRLRQAFPLPLHRERIARALQEIDRLQVSTIHSFCQGVLQSEGALCGLPVVPELVQDDASIVDEVVYQLWKKHLVEDGLAAAIAAAENWIPRDDARFVKMALAVDSYQAQPPATPFMEALASIRDAPSKFTPDAISTFESTLAEVTKRTKSAPSIGQCAEIIRSLVDAETANCPGFLSAAKAVASAAKWVNGRSNKTQQAAIDESELVQTAKELSVRLKRLLWDWRNFCAEQARTATATASRHARQITYDGIIVAVRNALTNQEQGQVLASRLRRKFKIALIDESQDTDARQFEIFRRVFVGNSGEHTLPGHKLVLIGDPKQAIYEFRGADVNTYLTAKSEALRRFKLTRTYRSPEPLVRATNALFARNGSLLKEGLDFTPATSGMTGDIVLAENGLARTARMEVWLVPQDDVDEYKNSQSRTAAISASVASEIARLLNTGAELAVSGGERRPVHPGDFAVLVSVHSEAAAIAAALRARNVPAIEAAGADVMTSDEARELLAILRAIEEPRRATLRRAAWTTRLLGKNVADLREMQMDTARDDAAMDDFLRWQAEFHQRGIAAAIARMDQDSGVIRRLAVTILGERRITNLRQLTDLLQSTSLELGNRPGQLVRWFEQEIERAGARGAADERQQQLESDAAAVQIVTMHAAKGLEYPLVFCPFLWNSKKSLGVEKITSPENGVELVNLDLIDDPAISERATRARLEDRLRLAYVAITRAKAGVWIYGGAVCQSMTPCSALDWLLRPSGTPGWSMEFADAAAKEDRGTRHAEGLADLIVDAKVEDVIQLCHPPAGNCADWIPQMPAISETFAALTPPIIPNAWVITSFSSLTREKHAHGEPGSVMLPPSVTAGNAATAMIGTNAFFPVPGGSRLGTAVHDWIEDWDFGAVNPGELQRHLAKYHLPTRPVDVPLSTSVGDMLGELKGTILPGLGCTVAEACPSAEASEWHFHLPINHALTPRALADIFARFGSDATRDYAARLADLSADALEGYLQGFLDRLAFWNGAWGVIDWKTNRVGDHPDYYQPAPLLEYAMQSHYLLQAHLYLVALRRWLGPSAPVAGAWLVFLRGVRAGTSNGILHIQPSEQMLDALDEIFGNPGGRP